MRAPVGTRATGIAVVIGLAVVALGASSAAAQDDDRARALALFEQSAERYRAGRFDEAAALLREAYALEPEPVLLYNLARALEGAGEDEEAADAYERYLESAGDEDEAEAARVRLDVLRRRLEERDRLEAQARAASQLGMDVPAPSDPAPTSDASDPTPWVLLGTGAGLAVVGAILGGLMLDRASVATDAPVHRDAVDALAAAESLAIAADAFYVVGGLVAGIGLVWGIALVAGGGDDSATASLRVGPGTLSLSVVTP